MSRNSCPVHNDCVVSRIKILCLGIFRQADIFAVYCLSVISAAEECCTGWSPCCAECAKFFQCFIGRGAMLQLGQVYPLEALHFVMSASKHRQDPL